MAESPKRPDTGIPPGDEIPPEDKSPFLIKKAQCPVCKFKSDQRRFKLKIYAEKNIDIDKHIQVYNWIDKDFQNYHPPLYYFWHCPNCYFTESFQDFEDPGKPMWSTFKLLKEDFTRKFQEDPKVEKLVSWLSKGIDYDTMNYTQAIRLHVLAIYIQRILEDEKDVDTLKVGRFLVRTGWLLREMKETKHKEFGTVKSILAEIRKLWPDVPTSEEDAMKKSLHWLTIAYQRHPGIKNPVAEVDMLMWLAGINLKLGDEEKGLEGLNQVLQRGQTTNVKLEQRLKTKGISAEEERNLGIQAKKIGSIVSKARDMMQDIQYKRFQAQKAEAKKIADPLIQKEVPAEEIRAKLKEAGFSPKVIAAVVPGGKKKKIFCPFS